ncbi:BBS7 [Acanthosepion pharaonis]|uniref:BBS7 n=1 Tax=Acanthosepion pharaonis TaxID=158019 RepID=A0A812BMX5_ACAPH|nr:BBS7 [Sepia pharaonis]
MDLNLTRIDYTQVGLTSPKTMELLPLAGKTQKIAIADNDGVVQCFSMKKGEVITQFKTLPSQKIQRLKLGGVHDAPKSNIFVASASEVRGFSKKGKQFLAFNTNISETIQSMYVEGADLFVCGNYIFNHYKECKDIHNMLCTDKINDVLCLPQTKEAVTTPVIACQDRLLRVIKGSDVLFKVEVPGPPSVLELFDKDGGAERNEVIYGTADGRIGLLELGSSEEVQRWKIENLKRNGGVTCLDMFDITGDGVMDLLVGRDDGLVDIYSFDESAQPFHKYAHTCNESITSIQGGIVGSPGYPEIVCSTYPGIVSGLTTKKLKKHKGPDGLELTNQGRAQLNALRQELEEIHKNVLQQREKFQNSGLDKCSVSSINNFHMNTRFVLNGDEACYLLSVELQSPIDNILIQSDVVIHMMDVDKNSAVVSFSACQPENGNCLLATYRCQASTTRLDLKIRTVEGQYGTLQVYVTPRTQPRICQVRQFAIKPLSLHLRTHSFDANRPFNSLKLKGQFSLAEAHSWVRSCLPEFPEKPPMGDTVTFHFVSSFQQTMLECSYSKGEVIFRSDNISTISILKDFLTAEATKRKIHLNITYDIDENSATYILNLMHPKLQNQLSLARKVQILEALKELQVHEKDLSFLSEDYKQIIDNADDIKEKFAQQPFLLDRLYDIL